MPELDADFVPKITRAVTELSKGMKSVSFYPDGHPALIQAVSRIISLFEEIPLPEAGLEIDVTKNALLFNDTPLPATNKSVTDLNRELYFRRASKVIFLPDLKPAEIVAFLKILGRDIDRIQDEGGMERVLLREKISRIWVNRVDYEGLTEMLKKEKEEVPAEGEAPLDEDDQSSALQNILPEELTLDDLLTLIEKETDPAEYRDYLIAISRALYYERMDRKIEYATRALKIFANHIDRPPMQNEEIAKLARLGIKEMASEELISHYVYLLREKGGRGNKEVETILAAFDDRAVKPLLRTLADEEDLLIRKSIVEIIARIGRPAVPAILENLGDARWFMVRNMVTILGSLGLPDLAPHVATVLTHPDLRVKKEAIKALSKLPHPSSVNSLGDLCFFPEETVALTATGAMASKKEPEAVLVLYRRVVHRRFLYPAYRLAHEAIDSLRAIGTDEAVTALEEILRTKAVWETQKFRIMKIHALKSISKISGGRASEALQNALRSPEPYLRMEAERLVRKG
ncbi:MAG: HEAT repeat domain-containing protein [Deltaproteobacteria bacterium]|nr:HEAT repeat domain-containing protein [Deltaproteobacteria bacterium]